MKKQMVVIFTVFVALSLNADIKQSAVNRLEKIKSRLNKEVDELKKCFRKDQNCDPIRKKVYISVATIGSLILATTTAGTVAYFVKRKKKIGKKESLFGPRESVVSPVRESGYLESVDEFGNISTSSQKSEAFPESAQTFQPGQSMKSESEQPVIVQVAQPQQESLKAESEKIDEPGAIVQPVEPQQEESRESEGEEEFFSASESEYESAEGEGESQEVASPSINLMRRIETMTSSVENQIQLLTDSMVPHMPEMQYVKDRLERASVLYLNAGTEHDLQEKLKLLQEAHKILREPYKSSK